MVRALLRTGFLLLLGGLLVLPAIAGAGSGDRMGRVQGRLVELHKDVIGGEPIPGFGLHGARGRLALSPDQPRELIGQKVVVEDESNRAGLQGEAEATSGTRELAASPPGPRTVAVVLVNFTAPDDVEPVTPAQIKSTVFTGAASANKFFQQQSDGQTSLVGRDEDDDDDLVADDGVFDGVDHAGDVFGWWTLNMAKPTCSDQDMDAEMDDIITKARAYDGTVGVDLDLYDHVSFYFPNNTGCDWGGLGELPGRYTWINGSNQTRLFAHELGHNMGVHHAASLNCGTVTLTQSGSGCSYSEYGDGYDVMGSSTALMSAWHRAQLGQLPASARTTATVSGSVTLDAVNDSFADDPRLLLVPRRIGTNPVTQYFAVELRSPSGNFDLFSLSSPQVTGVTIRLVPLLSVVQTSQLLDTHPGDGAGFTNSGLQPGETFVDPRSGVRIRNDATGGGTASLTVTVNELDTQAPTAPALSVVDGDSGPVLSWTAATDNVGIDAYEVRRNGIAVADTPAGTLSYTDTGAFGMAQASYQVVAVDTAANSTASNTVVFSLPDVTPPSMAVASAERRTNGDVALSFSGVDDRGVEHYAVSWPGGGAIVTGSQWIHTGAPLGATSYVVVAVDAAGNVSTAMTVSVGAAAPPASEAKPTTLAPLPRLILTRGRGGRIIITVSGATRISIAGGGWRAAVSGQRLSKTLPARLRSTRKAKLDVRAVVNGQTLRATLYVRRGVVSVR